jgi:2-keto-4-pentenoate hydratase/2-oxohepta-3-ene-1,7-dioic acid hydratase in catechol pathway
MKLITFECRGHAGYGAVKGDGIVNLAGRLGKEAPTLLDCIARRLNAKAAEIVAAKEPDLALADVKLRLPLPAPGKILCIGINYQDRNAEYRDNTDQPKYPSVFVRFPASFVAHGEALIRPPESTQFDYEGEIVLVIGKAGRRIRASRHRHTSSATPLPTRVPSATGSGTASSTSPRAKTSNVRAQSGRGS